MEVPLPISSQQVLLTGCAATAIHCIFIRNSLQQSASASVFDLSWAKLVHTTGGADHGQHIAKVVG